MKHTSSAAQLAHPTLSLATNCETLSESEMRLDRLSDGEPVAHVYQDEDRDWMDLVDDDMVYAYIARADFQAYVRLICALA